MARAKTGPQSVVVDFHQSVEPSPRRGRLWSCGSGDGGGYDGGGGGGGGHRFQVK